MDRADAPSRLEAWGVPAVVAALSSLLFLLLSDDAFLDWDTYERVQFIEIYQLELDPDGHILYHLALRVLLGLGVTPLSAIYAVTAGCYGLLLVAAWYVARARGLRGRTLAIALGVLVVASPGIAALVLTAEDNVAYLAPLLLAFHWLTLPGAELPEEARRGAAAGAMLGVALLINVTVVVYLGVFAVALLVALLGRRGDALRLTVAGVAMLAVYYLAHAFVFPGARVAMHAFLPQALALRDFEQSRAPLASLERLYQYGGGFRATALIPTLHAMAPSDGVSRALLTWAPALLAVAYVLLAARGLRRLAAAEGPRVRWVAPAALVFVAVLFPYLYEPVLIERWDIVWLWLFLAFVALLRSAPRAGAEVLVALVCVVQGIGTTLVAAHHFGRAYEREDETEIRATVEALRESGADPLVLPMSADRLHVAYVSHHHPRRRLFLIGREGGAPICHVIIRPVRERTISCVDAMAEVDGAAAPYVHWAVTSADLEAARTAE